MGHNVWMLIILDGFGYSSRTQGNAIANAKMPFWQFLCTNYPSALLKASGPAVGLPDGYMGNSEVGHLALGAGRIINSPLKKLHDSIDNGSFFNNEILINRFNQLKEQNAALHIMGLLSDAGVHSHDRHLQAFITLAHNMGLKKIFIHAFLDGRDSPPRSAQVYLERLGAFCDQHRCGTIASLTGRFYAMDRDKNWDRTQAAYETLCGLTKKHITPMPWLIALQQAYKNNTSDEFVLPQMLEPDGIIKPGDGVVFFNFRPDRARQLSEAFINPSFQQFKNPCNTGNKSLAFFITPTRYKDDFKAFNNDTLFEQEYVDHTLLDEIAAQAKCPPSVYLTAETEKYAHITYFFRGLREVQLSNETRFLVPSIKTKSYANTPEMSAPIITNNLIYSLQSNPANLYVVNYANADMVGHSGDLAATIEACQIIDQQLALLYQEVIQRLDGTLFITADHGNAEEKTDTEGNVLTAHTCNPVPFVLVSKKKTQKIGPLVPFKNEARLGITNVAPTILRYMNFKIPSVMEQETIF